MKLSQIHIFFLALFSLNYFSIVYAHDGILKALSYAYMLGTIILSVPYFFRKSRGFILPVQLISISILFSIFMAYISWDQSLIFGVSTIPNLIWFVFFLILKKEYPIENIEKIIQILGIIYIVLYFFQFINNDVVYFGYR